MRGYFARVSQSTPTRFWINNATVHEARLALSHGAVGCTQNPSYVWKLFQNEQMHDDVLSRILRLVRDHSDDQDVLVQLQRELVGMIASEFRGLYETSDCTNGYVSIQGDPHRETAEQIIGFARLHRQEADNIMVKIPVTSEGLEAIETCILEGMPVNATEIMSVSQAVALCEVQERAVKGMAKAPPVYLSHIAGIFDEYLAVVAERDGIDIPTDHLWQAGRIVARKIRAMLDERGSTIGFINGGARGLHHFTEWVGGRLAVTINWKGTADALASQNPPVVCRFENPVSDAVLDSLLLRMPDFARAWHDGGLKRTEFESFGAVQLFCSGFRAAWDSALEAVARVRSSDAGQS